MSEPILLHLTDDGKAEFGDIFPDGVPIQSPWQCVTNLAGHGDASVYLVDWTCLDTTQQRLLLERMAARFDAPAAEIQARIERDGYVAIRSEWCQLVTSEVLLV